MDLTTVSPAWATTSWAFGVDETYTNIGMSPNSCALLRVLWFGELEIWGFDIVSLQKACRKAGMKLSNMDEAKAIVRDMQAYYCVLGHPPSELSVADPKAPSLVVT